MAEDRKEVVLLALPEGRVINNSLFQKDIYTDPQGREGTPSYKIELAFDPGQLEGSDDNMSELEEAMLDAAIDKWGAGVEDEFFDTGKMRIPFLNGDKLAKRREERGKTGEAYKGKLIIRAHTIFNRHGEDGPGGVQVWSPDVKSIDAANSSEIYNGCFGIAGVTINTYVESGDDQRNALGFYLSAFQKTKDGERLVAQRDTSTLFKPVGRSSEGDGETRGRRSRKS